MIRAVLAGLRLLLRVPLTSAGQEVPKAKNFTKTRTR